MPGIFTAILATYLFYAGYAWASLDIAHGNKNCSKFFSKGAEQGSSSPFAPGDDKINFVGLDIKGDHSNIKLFKQNEDLLIHVDFDNSVGGFARIELPGLNKEANNIALQSSPSQLDPNNFFLGKTIPYGELRHDQIAFLDVGRLWTSFLYGFHFISSTDFQNTWRLIITTDVSEMRSRELGGVLTYEAIFTPSIEGEAYVFLPMENFKPVLNRQFLPGEPSLGDKNYQQKVLRIRSVALETETNSLSSQSNLRIRYSELGLGAFVGFNAEQAATVLNYIAADPAIVGYPKALTARVIRLIKGDEGNRLFPELKSISRLTAFKVVAQMLLRMKQNSENFPEGDIYKGLKNDQERRTFLNRELGKIPSVFQIGPYRNTGGRSLRLGKELNGKVHINELWVETLKGQIPVEKDYFASLHGRYSHALQFIVLLKGASDYERLALAKLMRNQDDFNFVWNLCFDSRSGDVNDPSWWRQRYEPTLPP